MRVVIQKPDLDTCLAALILGVAASDEIVIVRSQATVADLQDPAVLCLEAGGAGQVHLRNFDHHGTNGPLAPACVQALTLIEQPSEPMRRLVDYVAALDTAAFPSAPPMVTEDVLTLSEVFSGMRFTISDPREQFISGIALLREVLQRGFNPFGPLPELNAWSAYFKAKRHEIAQIREAQACVVRFTTKAGRTAGFLETGHKGALGAVYGLGCDVAVAFDPAFQIADGTRVPKFSIGGRNGLRVDALLPALAERETGWGGPSHGTVIGSPHDGTALAPDDVKQMISDLM